MKEFAIIAFICSALTAKAQNITKYYDKDWQPTLEEKAVYFATFTPASPGYAVVSYYTNTKVVRGISSYMDTSFTKPIGLVRLYDKKGLLEDSSLYDQKSNIKETFHYYPNKKLELHYIAPSGSGAQTIEAYDENGGRIKNYIFMKDAEPAGGIKGWQGYLKKAASKELYSKSEQKEMVHLQVHFLVDENGYISRVKVTQSSGNMGADNDALSIISSAPRWSPLIMYYKPVKSYQTQPISYELLPVVKKK